MLHETKSKPVQHKSCVGVLDEAENVEGKVFSQSNFHRT